MSGSSGPRNYNFRISAEGMQEFAADVRRLSGESDAVHAAFAKLIQASPQLANAMTAAQDATRKAADAARQLRETQDRAASNANALPEQLGRLEARAQSTGRAVADLRGAMELLGASGAAGALGPVSGLIGNIADAFSTASLASTRFAGALAAITPQGAALAGLVALPAILQSVGLGISTAGEEAGDAAGATDRWNAALERLAPTLDQIAEKARRAGIETARAQAAALELEYGRLLESRGAAIGQVGDLDRQIAAAEGRLGTASDAIGRARNPTPLMARQLQADLEAAERQLLALRDQRATLMRGAGGIDPTQAYNQMQDRIGALFAPYGMGPNLPAAGAGGGGGGAAPRPGEAIEDTFDRIRAQMLGRIEQQEQRDAERARQQREREEEQHLRRIEQANQQTTNEIVRYAGDAFADLFADTGGGFERMMQRFRQTAIQTFARIGAEAIIRPIVAPIVQGLGLGGLGGGGAAGGGGGGGLGDLLGLGSSFGGLTGGGGIADALGLSGYFGAGSILATPLMGSAALATATNSALAGMGGAFGPATLSQVGAASGWGSMAGLGAASFGQLLGGAGLGFGAGTLLNSLVGGKAQGGMIGSGAGAAAGAIIGSIIPGIGTILGGLIGGAGGGLLGGMFGPSASNRAGDADFDFATGQFTIGGQTGRKFSQANRDAALGLGTQLRDSLGNIATAVGGTLPGSGVVRVGVGDRDGLFLRLPGQDGQRFARSEAGAQDLLGTALRGLIPGISGGLSDRFRGALSTAGATSAGEIGEIAQWFATVFRPLTEVQEPVDAFEAAMKALNDTFNAATERAKELGLGETELAAGRARAVAELQQQRRDAAAGVLAGPVSSLADFVRSLRVANDNPLSPNGRLDAARADFDATITRALDGDLASFGRVQGSAQALLAVSRDVNGSGTGFAADFQATLSRLDSLSGLSDDRLTASVYAAEQRSATEVLRAELERLRGEISGLRAEVAQGNRIPARLSA